MVAVGTSRAGQAGFAGVIAIDGPSGSGKSTVSRRLALRLGVAYLDTGAMYRAATWAVLQAGIDPADLSGVADVVAQSWLEIGIDPATPQCRMNGVDVTASIRGPEVTAAVSAVAANPRVRQRLVAQQQAVIAAAKRGEAEFDGFERQFDKRGIVTEGRDTASAVAPDALLKVYLTASQAVRATRRHRDVTAPVPAVPADGDESSTRAQLEQVARDLQRRDTLDRARAMDPLRVVPDAVVLDTTDLSVDDVVTTLVELHTAAVEATPGTATP